MHRYDPELPEEVVATHCHNPVVALGQLALDTFCSAPPPREQCPKYLARLVPVAWPGITLWYSPKKSK